MSEEFKARLFSLVEEWTRHERDPDLEEDTARLRDLVVAMANKVAHVNWPSGGQVRQRNPSFRFRCAYQKYGIEDIANVLPARLLNGVYWLYYAETNAFLDKYVPGYAPSKVAKADLLLRVDLRRVLRAENVGKKSVDDLIEWREAYRKHIAVPADSGAP
jgi:hypothetical protein